MFHVSRLANTQSPMYKTSFQESIDLSLPKILINTYKYLNKENDV